MVTMQVQMAAIKDIKIQPLSNEQKKKIITESFGDISSLNALNVTTFLTKLQITIRQYLQEYNTTWAQLEQSFSLMNKISNLSQEQNKTSAYINLKNEEGHAIYVQNFIRTLEKGNLLLDYIRMMLTGQAIETYFTIKGSDDEIFYTDKSNVNYKLVLSTYGASGNNFVSLAYEVDVKATIAQLKNDLNQQTFSIKGTDIYARIMQVKDEYLIDLEQKAAAEGKKKKYPRWYDSKDAEIFDLMKQRLESGDIKSLTKSLTMKTYRNMRRTMGGRGGYRTSSTQLGDVGLSQDKLVTEKVNQVNFARQTLIKNRFEDMNKALLSLDKNTIKQMFLTLFTEKQSRVDDNISKMANREAQKAIKKLFE